MYKKRIIIAFCLILLLAGCRTTQVPEPDDDPIKKDFLTDLQVQKTKEPDPHDISEPHSDIAEMRPENLNTDELTITFSRHDIELDFRKSYFASEAQIFTGIYEGLFTYHPMSLEPVPALAERWELSEDKMQWTFTIRRNARYCNGDPVRAEDFRTAWISLIEPWRESPYSSFFDVIEGVRDYRNGIDNDPDKIGIIAVDQRTLVVKLNSPAAFFPAMLCHHSFNPIHPSMINKEQWSPKDTSENWTPPVSNGPFRIVSMDDDSIVMVKNENYWDRNRVALNKITIKFTSTADEAAHYWNSGEARWISGDVNLDALTDRSGIQYNVMFATHYYFIRSSQKPWDDPRVRRAMALVLPWDDIRRIYLLPATTLIYPIAGYPDVEGISETDIEEAKRLMAEAGYESLEGMPELVIRLVPAMDAMRIVAFMAYSWEEHLGFKVRTEILPFNRYYSSMKDDGYTVASTTWIGDFADPYAFLQMWRKDSNLNDAHHNDPDYEALIERSMTEEGAVRMATLSEAESILLNRGTILPIYYNPALNIVDTGELNGWYPNALDIHPLKYLSFRTFRPLPGVVMLK